jgi:hypothetical protein
MYPFADPSFFPILAPTPLGRHYTVVRNVQGSVTEINKHMVFNHEVLSYRQTAEWGMCGIQGAFGRLCILLEIANKHSWGDLIDICIQLHNLHTI